MPITDYCLVPIWPGGGGRALIAGDGRIPETAAGGGYWRRADLNVHVPNREAAAAEKFFRKLVWLQALRAASMPPRAGSSAFGPYTGDRRIRLDAGITRIRRAFPEPPNISAPA